MALATAKRDSNVDVVIYGQTNALMKHPKGASVLAGVDLAGYRPSALPAGERGRHATWPF